jgi:hypothetical protein
VETATKGGKKADNLLAKQVDPPHPIGLLRLSGKRPKHRCCRAPEQRDERAPLHSITSSARASGALEDASGMCAELTKRIRNAGSVAHQPGSLGS